MTVRADVDDVQACKTLAHELGHVMLHHRDADDERDVCRDNAEVEAESVAFLVAAAHGLSTDDYSFAYVAGWVGLRDHAEVVEATGRSVLTTAHTILDRVQNRDTAAIAEDLVQLRDRAAAAVERSAALVAEVRNPAPRDDDQVAAVRAVLVDAHEFFINSYRDSWASLYVESRFGLDVATDPSWGFGMAPARWTGITDALRSRGHADEVLEAAGVCLRTKKDTLVDQFRDRVILPIHDEDGQLVSFVGRRNPASEDERAPKYLNGPATVVYRKGDHLYGANAGPGRDAAMAGARPTLVEGPFDAIAVTVGTDRRSVGVGTCGTALTDAQADELVRLAIAAAQQPAVATDADKAGYDAADRAHFALQARNMPARSASLPPGADPAQVLETVGGFYLVDAIENGRPLVDDVVDRRLDSREPMRSIPERVAAARFAGQSAAGLPAVLARAHRDHRRASGSRPQDGPRDLRRGGRHGR